MKRHLTSTLLIVTVWLAGWTDPAFGLQLRNYTAVRHDRFTGYPAAPAWNSTAWFGSSGYQGIGWAVADTSYQRQFALVSPLHLVCATHFQPNIGAVIRFLNRDGITVDRTIAAHHPVKNDLNQNTDLTLLTLSAPLLAADQVAHFPYLSLPDEAAYLNTSLVVAGWHVKAGRGRIAAFEDVSGEVNQTRMLRFDYHKWFGQQDDCYLENGDSGSPSFAVVDDRPTVVGIHSAVEEDPFKHSSYDTFVPHYTSALNTLMEPDGYQMTPSHPPPVTLAVAATHSPDPWRQAMAASCRIDLTNNSGNPATNPTVTLHFRTDRLPDTLTAPGWIITTGDPGERLLHRATLAAAETSALTASWTDTGTANEISVQMELRADGLAEQSYDFSRPLAPSYQAWAADLADPSPAADPDEDGVPNLLEYAFGGDPEEASQFQATGAPLLPRFAVTGSTATLRFPLRDDAELRGLTYLAEFSETLAAGSWAAEPPPGATVTDAPMTPAVPGFLQRTITAGTNTPKRFYRVRVELNEGGQ
ncbi:MAG: S1 family peptidase [Akkermansiaceae bacterium]|nr:S1 family peptidase [Akkermansiaceae bacterium]MCF7733691.1 S1 family peptidase [Akkermansiaceae bacterium]